MTEVKFKYRSVTSFDRGMFYAPYIPLDLSKLIAEDIIGVQPMTGSCGEIFTLTRRCTHHKKTCPPYGFKVSRCTCHPDDNPPEPCAQKYAYSECVKEVKKYKPIDLATLRGLP